jgi:DNA polymerase III delta prime subunit
MTSFIICSPDKSKRNDYIERFCKKNTIAQFDIAVIDRDTSKNLESIGIEEIKNLHKKIFLKPMQSDKKIVVLDDAHLLTIEAQNALLKVLEEPPDHTFIFLATRSLDALLPTILSRCKIIELETESLKITVAEETAYEEFMNTLLEMRVGDRLKTAEELAKDKENAIEWIGKLILFLRKKLLDDEENVNHFVAIKSFQGLYTLLKTTNVNPRFAIENTLLNLYS